MEGPALCTPLPWNLPTRVRSVVRTLCAYVSIAAPAAFTVHNGTRPLAHSPVVCGFGPAGLFAALLLARQGFRPIVLERGPAMEQRAQAVERFNAAGLLDENANIQFGEGGAGTFSDGKLTTRINDPLWCFCHPDAAGAWRAPGYCLQAEAAHRHRCAAGCYCVYPAGGRGAGREGAFQHAAHRPARAGRAACGGVHAAGRAALRCAAARAGALGPGYI